MTPPKTEFKETETNISKTNSTSDRSSESGQKSEKVKSQIISGPKQTSLFSMDFLEDDDSQDQIEKPLVSHRSQEKEKLDEDLMKLIDDSLDTKQEEQVTSAIDALAQKFKGLNLSGDMPSSIGSQHESNSNQSFEDAANTAQEYFPSMGQQLYFPPLQQLQVERQMPTIS